MAAYIVGFRYFAKDRPAVTQRNSVVILANSESEAMDAFLATHQTTAGRYEIAYCEHTEA